MIVLEDTSEDTPARKLVSELMILANETGALFAAEHGVSLVFRGQERPDVNVAEQGQHIPEGPAREYAQRGFLKRSTVGVVPCPHFGLGIKAYSQLTSPIRRVVDLINQRQLSTFLAQGAPRYTADEVSALLIDIEPYLDEASYLQRTRHRYWLHRFLMQEGITHLPAVVVRVDGPKPLAELEVIYTLSTFVPMRREGGAHGLKVGQRVNLKIQEIHPRRELFLLSEV
jgi:exoribonuclease-2